MYTSHSFKRTLAASVAALVLGGAALGIANAQSTSPTPAQGSSTPAQGQTQQADRQQQQQSFLAALAKRLGITTDQLQQAITNARSDVGLPAQAGGGFGFGPGGPEHGGFGRGASFDAAAQAIGISVDQLQQELVGKSLAQVAQAHGKSASDVATALKNAANQRIDQEVSAGRLTADQATQRKRQESQRIDQLVNQVLPQGRPGGPGGRGGFGRGQQSGGGITTTPTAGA